MMKKKIVLAIWLWAFALSPALGGEVPINPITPDIRNKLKESTELVGQVEDSMAPKVSELEQTYKTYMDTCKGKEADRGCVALQDQVRDKYRDVLKTMSGNLPKVRKSMDVTARELGTSIKKKTWSKDFKDLYEEVSKKGSLPKVRGPLSKKLTEIVKVLGNPNINVSLLELSLQTQADLITASEILDYLEANLNSQLIAVDMIQDFGVLSPQMASVMNGVGQLFGYDMGVWPVTEEPGQGISGDDWRQ